MFNPDLAGTFKVFSLQHLIASSIVFLIVALVIINKEKLRDERYFNKFRIGFAVITLGQEVVLNIYRIAMGEWMISTSLPFQLCGLAVITSSVVLLTQNEKIFRNTFFIMMIGATMAILTPGIENALGFPHFRYFQFFTSHGMILVNFAFILFVMNFQKDFKYKLLLNNFVVVSGLAIVMLLINLAVDGNYMYLMGVPYEGTAFDLFGPHPWYLLNILLIGIPVLFHLFYLPFLIRNFRRKRKLITE